MLATGLEYWVRFLWTGAGLCAMTLSAAPETDWATRLVMLLCGVSTLLLGDQGAYLRTTMKAMALFSLPPESHWPYDIGQFDVEPPAFCYAFAQSYQALKYYRLDPPGQDTSKTLEALKENLAAGLPAMFGFTVYSSIPGLGDGKGEIPFPKPGDMVEGGHAIVAVGYDDTKKIDEDTGALLIRNSWGIEWGMAGYGWLPYSYVQWGLAVDFWSLIESKFTDTDLFV